VLVDGGRALPESTAILHFIDARLAPERRLFPDEPALRREVEALEQDFDERLGPHTRRLVYYHLLPDRELTLAAIGQRAPRVEVAAARLGYPLLTRMLRR